MTKEQAYAIHALIVAMLDENARYPKDLTQYEREVRVNEAHQRLLTLCADDKK